jgi:hypothetical protein
VEHHGRVAVRVVDPEGRSWRVRRQWAPRLEGRGFRARFRRRRRKEGDSWSDWLDLPFDLPDSLTAVLVMVALVAFIVVFVLFGIPLVLALFDLVVVVALVVGGVVARVAFRRPWTVEAVSVDGRRWCAQAVGWSASGALRRELADRLAAGWSPEEIARRADDDPPA